MRRRLHAYLNPDREPMTWKDAVRRFVLLALTLYIAGNVVMLSQYGALDWTPIPDDGRTCPAGMFCGTAEPAR